MTTQPLSILALNPGSSSVKAVLRTPALRARFGVDRLDSQACTFTVTEGDQRSERPLAGGIAEAVDAIADVLAARGLPVDAVAHRVVHGGPGHFRPTIIDDSLLADLRESIGLAPLHLPADLTAIEHARRAWPRARQVACFDTGFYHDLPLSSRRLPVAAELAELGVRRYGFHGLSVQSVLDAHPDLGNVVVAHLGSGCSVTAVQDGRPRHTSMSMTPTSGMVSATRAGDLDPEIALYLIQQHGYDPDRLRTLLDRSSGLAGIAGGRHDIRDLLDAPDEPAKLAVEIFFASAAMTIAGCASRLSSWQSLVFTGGIGANSPEVRNGICERLLAVRGSRPSDPAGSDGVSSLRATGLRVLAVPADEESVLDRLSRQLLGSLVREDASVR